MKLIFLFLLSFKAFSFTLNTNIDASFNKNEVKIWVTQNSNCENIGLSNSELLSSAIDAANKFWNRVPSSYLNLIKGGILNTSDDNFISGILCVEDSNTSCDESVSVPKVNDIVIACNQNESDNFINSNIYALSIPSKVSNGNILGSIILLNDSINTKLNSFSKEEITNLIAHELGHAIGIGHSNDPSALMYSTYYANRKRLGMDDMDAVTYLYPNKLDGCSSFIGSIKTNSDNDSGSFFISILCGILLVFLLNLIWKISKRYKTIAWN